MKQFLQGIGITLLMAISILGLGTTLNAQVANFDSSLNPIRSSKKIKLLDNDIKMLFSIYLNEKSVESDQVTIELTNIKTKSAHTVTTSNNFCTYLRPDEMYAIKISHPGYNSKTILVNTKIPNSEATWQINTAMYLYTNKPDEYSGVLYYNKRTDNFEAGPYKAK